MTLPINTTGWGSQCGSPTARSSRKAPIKRALEEFKISCPSMMNLVRANVGKDKAVFHGHVRSPADQFTELSVFAAVGSAFAVQRNDGDAVGTGSRSDKVR